MAHDNVGVKNQPQYAGSGVPADAADMSEIANYAALVGNRKAGASTTRTALTGADLWSGLQYYETDTKLTWIYDGSAWKQPLPYAYFTTYIQGAPDGQLLASGTVALPNPDVSQYNDFATGSSTGTVALTSGLYAFDWQVQIGGAATGRTLLQAVWNDTPTQTVALKRQFINVGDEQGGLSHGTLVVPTAGRSVLLQVFKTNGATSNINGVLTIVKLR